MTTTPERLAATLSDRYRIVRELGHGGMATVYLAEDLKHHRQVAIKVLRPELAAALGAERFLREIETTANLRHPHILPLFDSGAVTVDDSRLPSPVSSLPSPVSQLLFYVMPLVEGESLRSRLDREKQLPIDSALQIAREVADALNYAHAHGVVHRDIKPENILLESGHAVVADFGIAKALAEGQRPEHPSGAKDPVGLTETGMAIGTVRYMSPEQATGTKDIDGRSDLYALGCVLYEMLAGQPPFTGPTVESVVHQHIAANPPPITQLRPTVSASVATALQRALAKAPADRFADGAQFAHALEVSGPVQHVAVRRSITRPAVAAALGIGALLALGLYLGTHRTSTVLQLGHRTQVTLDPGPEVDPALSPEGKVIAYSGARGELAVRQVEGGVPIQVVREGDGRGRWPVWVEDGQRLAFISSRGIELVPALGGAPRLLIAGTELASGLAPAPDGRSVAFVSHDSIMVVSLPGGEVRFVVAGQELHSPAWSPDGRWIAFVSGNRQYINSRDMGNAAPSAVWLAPASGGKAVRITEEHALNVSPAWASPRTLLFISDRDGGRDVYQVGVTASGSPVGVEVRLTTGLNPHSIAASLDGKRLAYSAFSETSNVWSLPIPTAGPVSASEARPVTVGRQTVENFGVSHDGQWIAFSSDRSGTTQIYRSPVSGEGAEPKQLTVDTAPSFWADWSPDGKEIAFHRFSGDHRQSFVMSSDGGTPVQVTNGPDDERSPEWSPDGHQLLLLANWATRPTLNIVSRNAAGQWSSPQPLPIVVGSDTLATWIGAWSPDNRFIACSCGVGGIVIVPLHGGSPYRLKSPFSTAGWALPQWSADGRTVFHIAEDSGRVAAVVAVPISGEPPRVVVRFDDPTRPWHRYGFRVRAGRIFFNLGDVQSDIWVAEIERGR